MPADEPGLAAATGGGRAAVLAGRSVLITGERRSGELASALQRRGATTSIVPALSMIPGHDDDALMSATGALTAKPPDIVVITTGIGLRGWIEAADAHGRADPLLAVLHAARIVARGPKALGAIQAAGLSADWVAESETSAEIIELLLAEGVAGLRVAVQHHGAGADGIDTALLAGGADVVSLVVYRWGPPPDAAAVSASTGAAAEGDVDVVVFTSAPAAHAWLEAAADAGSLAGIRDRCAAGDLLPTAVGPITAAPLRAIGIEPLLPERARLGALVRALVARFADDGNEVDTVAGRLQLRPRAAMLDGATLTLTPSSLSVLRVLVEAAGQVVPRERVLQALPGCSLDPHAAEVAIARLRESTDRQLIRTIFKRGYRLEVAE
jgi:uroporphyrinogen-III synthase